jgi:hypothetical protein
VRGARLVPALAVLVLVVACGDEVRGGSDRGHEPAPKPTAVPGADGDVTTGGPVTVLDDGDGAELCLGAVATSNPPQCGGPPLVGWDWADHQGDFESGAGVRWGDFMVTGTFDGTSVTPSDVVPADEFEGPSGPTAEDDQFATPCPEPDGGWRVVDPALTTERTLQATMQRAEKLDGYAESWLDQSLNPADSEEITSESGLNDPTLLIVNVRVTSDPGAAEMELRKGWGGSLCVSVAEHTLNELQAIQDQVNELPGVLISSPDRDFVEVYMTYDDGSYQNWADATFGEGVVRIHSALAEVDVG